MSVAPAGRVQPVLGFCLALLMLAAVGLLLDITSVRYQPLPGAPEPVPVTQGEEDRRSVGQLQVHNAADDGMVSLVMTPQFGNGVLRWHWERPVAATAVRITGQVSHHIQADPQTTWARAYLSVRQPGEGRHPHNMPVAGFLGTRTQSFVDGRVVLFNDTRQMDVSLGFYRTHGDLQLNNPRLQWLQPRAWAELAWRTALGGWVVWLAWLVGRWWQATPGQRRLLWSALGLVAAPLFFSIGWLSFMRETVHMHTGIQLGAALPFGLMIGQVVHFGLFFGLTLAAAWLMPLRPWRTRVLELAALATATEFVQEYIPGRSLKLQDWATNLVGIACALLLLAAWQAIRARSTAAPHMNNEDIKT